MKLNVNIQRGEEVNAFLFDCLGAVAYSGGHTIETAYAGLKHALEGNTLYRVHLGHHVISVATMTSGRRIASISK